MADGVVRQLGQRWLLDLPIPNYSDGIFDTDFYRSDDYVTVDRCPSSEGDFGHDVIVRRESTPIRSGS